MSIKFLRFGGHDWRVLDVQDGKALLLSEHVLSQRAYHDKFRAVTWEACTLRRYLNYEFYNSLSTEDRVRIAETRLENEANQWYGTDGGNDTIDRIFLLSLEELVRYFGDSGKLGNKPKDTCYIYDEYNAKRIAKNSEGEARWWWLRSPGDNGTDAANVDSDGDVSVCGIFVDNVYCGVRPALWLNLESSDSIKSIPTDAQSERM